MDFDQNTHVPHVAFSPLFVSLHQSPSIVWWQSTENNSNNKHEKKAEKQKEENDTANRVNEVSFVFN